MEQRCLVCYKPLHNNDTEPSSEYHAACSKKFFGQTVPPILPYTEQDMETLAAQSLVERITVPGVQPKISLEITNNDNTKKNEHPRRFTIVGLWGSYILKPPTEAYPELPEIEDVTMHLAALAGIQVVPHSLIRMASGTLAYITRRIDRTNTRFLGKQKLHLEDMCQVTERLTEEKYHGSYEQIAKAMQQYSARPGLDVVYFFEQILFSFLTGNADMHLKNFSLLHDPAHGIILAPGYDMLSTVLVNPNDTEDLALTLNGKKKNLRRKDFVAAFSRSSLNERQQSNIFARMLKARTKWHTRIEQSFLSMSVKQAYLQVLNERFERLYS